MSFEQFVVSIVVIAFGVVCGLILLNLVVNLWENSNQ
jgi:hypothetical protein